MAPEVSDPPLVIPEAAYPYAVVQSGAIHAFKDRPSWFAERFDRLQRQRFASILDYLPAKPGPRILDVGGGLGGIDVLLSRHYGGLAHVWLLDGVAGPAVVDAHDKPFNDMEVSRAFLAANGVDLAGFWTPRAALTKPEAHYRTALGFDLVVSFAAWGFHIGPGIYAETISAITRSDAVIILDVRRDRRDWRDTLERWFRFVGVCEEGTKYERCVYERP